MCGIFGQLTSTQADIELVQRMARRIAHRGPDGYNVFCEGHFAFGAGRLAIIDLDAPAGALWNEDRSVGVVFNGEIYNFAILREELIKTGHHFVTHTEKIQHILQDYFLSIILVFRNNIDFRLAVQSSIRYRNKDKNDWFIDQSCSRVSHRPTRFF